MAGNEQATGVGQLPNPQADESRVAATLTRLAWALWVASLGVLAAHVWTGETWSVAGALRVDGLTVVLWTAVTFFSGVVHSYSRRYMAGSRAIGRFFSRVFGFTLAVMVLVAADSLALFAAAWLLLGLAMADLVGTAEEWPQAQAAASVARRYFLAGSALVALALAALWWQTGATTVSGVTASISAPASPVVLLAAGALLLAAMVQSALLPFHRWLLSSMTAPTPASALMHAGFVNAGGVLLVRFAPVVTVDAAFMLAVVLVGAASALGGKLLKTVQTDVKSTLGCSTVGQMGFMIMQAGLGFFGAAITHLVLHGFYKAYQFLASGSRVAREVPSKSKPTGGTSAADAVVVAATGLAAGGLFAVLTGEGLHGETGLLLAGLVALTALHAAREFVAHASLPTPLRYGAVPLATLVAVAIYAAAYGAISGLLAGLPAVGEPAELTAVHGVVAAAFLAAYVAVETGAYRRSERLYVALLNASRPASETLLTSTEEYNEY